ncbi:MAG: peptide chain release factor 2 [Candidatus Omnitrophica bacterium]|nr:peptide chain release factor 2 [Candidatus Omnitrophota bacterium]
MTLKEIREQLDQLRHKLQSLRGYLDAEKRQERIRECEAEMADQGFWNDPARAQETVQRLKQEKGVLEPFLNALQDYEALGELLGMVEASDHETLAVLEKDLKSLSATVGKLEFQKLLGSPHDSANAILSVNAGAGGTESCDWAAMLLRMYARWAEIRKFSTEMIDSLSGEQAGIKNATLIIRGRHAYGYLKAEIGVHRLVRISPFDANKRRHTSFASVDVIPEIEDAAEIEINPSDLRVDTYRSSGAGGQHVNVTDSAVRITHLPTGIVVQCQNERSQHKNRATALKVLRSRLYERELEEKRKELDQAYDQKQEIAWGSQIRSYVLHPYNLVKDLRTDYETSNTSAVLDGTLDGFMEAYLRWTAENRK